MSITDDYYEAKRMVKELQAEYEAYRKCSNTEYELLQAEIERLKTQLSGKTHHHDNERVEEENVMLQGALEGLKVGSCSCGTKTHEPEFHKGYCNYKRISAALAATPRTANISAVLDAADKVCESWEKKDNFLAGIDLSSAEEALYKAVRKMEA